MDRIGTSIVTRFMGLFDGLKGVYGRYVVTGSDAKGKQVGDNRSVATMRGEVTEAIWQAHLDGKVGLGIVPIRAENDCIFGAIDVDIYDLNHEQLAKKIRKKQLPLIMCRTKSGGAHLYLFTAEPVPAKKMKHKLEEVAAYLGFGGCEIFPKQVQIMADNGDTGSWINVPYFNQARTMRYAMDQNGNSMSVDEFLDAAEKAKVQTTWFSKLLVVDQDFEDGPPCLQILADVGYTQGSRNEGLVNIAVYLKKASPDDWETELHAYNNKYMGPPLGAAEVNDVIKSLKRKEYRYGCTKPPILSYCNSSVCRTRKYGVRSNANDTPMPSLGDMTKLATTPPLWFWTIDGRRIEFTTPEIQDQRLFQRRCMDNLNLMPPQVKHDVWNIEVNKAMQNAIIIEAPMDASPEGQFGEYLERYCTGPQAVAKREFIGNNNSKPFTENGYTYFKTTGLMAFLTRNKFTTMTSNKICSMLRNGIAEHKPMTMGGRTVNLWVMKSPAKISDMLEVPSDLTGKDEVF